jgi:hypothetical protein
VTSFPDRNNMSRWQGPSLPVGPDVATPDRSRNSFTPPLIDTISPGRTLPFGCTLIPAPPATAFDGFPAPLNQWCAYFTLARFRTPDALPEGAMLGFRLDVMSFMAEGGDSTNLTGRIFGGNGTPPSSPAPSYYPAATEYGCGAAIIIASGNKYRDEFADTPGNWSIRQHRFPTIAQRPPYFASSPQMEAAYVIRPPNGDLCGTVSAVQRMTTTNRDQPFGARITPNDDIYVVIAIGGAYAQPAAIAAGTNKYFPAILNGEIFVTPALDDRRMRDV